MEVALECFLVRVRERYKQTKLPLHNFDGKGASLVALAKKAIQPLVTGNYKKLPGKSLTLSDLKPTDLGFDGTLKVGEYGFGSDVIDVTDGSKAFDKKRHHAEQVPFYIRLHIPKGGDQGVLLLQRFGTGGVTGVVREIIRDTFTSKYPDHTLDIRPMVPDFVLKNYLTHGTPKAVTFIKNSIPADYADKVSGKSKEAKGKVEVTIKSSDSGFFQPKRVASAVTKVGGIESVYSFDDFEPDQIKMKVEIGGRVRTINLRNHANLRATFDISDKVKEDRSGYPHRGDVAQAAQEVLEEVAPAAGLKL